MRSVPTCVSSMFFLNVILFCFLSFFPLKRVGVLIVVRDGDLKDREEREMVRISLVNPFLSLSFPCTHGTDRSRIKKLEGLKCDNVLRG